METRKLAVDGSGRLWISSRVAGNPYSDSLALSDRSEDRVLADWRAEGLAVDDGLSIPSRWGGPATTEVGRVTVVAVART